ncbi:amidohydrolase family protein [Catenulispora rubra]|uniref:amidohydrolase family protein n=1 Tax=Catenulispora rubra TaxID=280293 RepID=UPI00189257C8|nr:amidohydrolase family protein [Catenulispora rubra]
MVRKLREVNEIHKESVRQAIAVGVKIAMGADVGPAPQGSNLTELALMVDAGLTPARSLVTATASAAELLGLGGEVGRIDDGDRTDLVLVDGDVTDIDDLARLVSEVWKDGRKVDLA